MELFRIGDLASEAGVSVDTVRYYERKGLLCGVVDAADGARRFPVTAADRIRVIRRAAAIGFSLDELARIFHRRASGQAPCGHVLDSAKRKLSELDDHIRELGAVRESLASVIAEWESRMHQTPDGSLAFLLESLVDPAPGK